MRLRSAAAAAAGVVAAIGLNAHEAAAEAVDESTAQTDPQLATTTTTAPQPPEWFSERDKERFARGQAEAAAEGNPKVRPEQKVIQFEGVSEPVPLPALPPDHRAAAPVRIATEPAAPVAGSPDVFRPTSPKGIQKPAGSSATQSAATATTQPEPVPTDNSSTPAPGPMPIPNAVTTKVVDTTPKATPPSAVAPVAAGDQWSPAWATDMADQRIAEKWGNAPVRGPPPSVATALGNSSTNTVTQVAVVRGRFGTEVAITTQTQRSDITNVGVAAADASGGGTASTTGDTADTSVIQVSVIVQRGTGTATIEQHADVDNIGVASATSAGAATATAVGNDSSTSVTQVAVVYIEGSGDAHVTQSAEVDNVGIASAAATDRSASAIGNQSTTDVTQVSVVRARNEDLSVTQTSNNVNIGVATADGGAASGNTATNATTQVSRLPR